MAWFQDLVNGILGPNPQDPQSMAGVLGPVQVTAPVAGPGSTGLPGATPLNDPTRQAAYGPPSLGWSNMTTRQKIGLFGATLSDMGAGLSGHPADANNLDSWSKQNKAQQILAALLSSDPATRQQAYAVAPALGIDPAPFRQQQAAGALPKLLSNLQPQINPVSVTPQVTGGSAGTGPGSISDPSRQAAYTAPPTTTPSLQDAVTQTGNPELTAQMAPNIVQDQIARQKSQVRQATPAEATKYGYAPTDPVYINDYTGEVTSPVKPKAAIQQIADTPETQDQRDTLHKPVSVPPGSTLVDPRTGKPIDASATSSAGDLHGSDYLKTLDPKMAAQVKGLAEGRIPFPTGNAMSRLQPLIQVVGQYDPSFDAVNYQARSKTRSDFTSGTSSKAITALNTALGHAAGLQDNFDKLGNTPLPVLNSIINYGKTQLGNAAPTIAAQNVDALASEGRKVFAASGGGNLTELENWQKNFPMNGSPEQQKGALKEFVSLLDSRMSALGDQYNKGMGTTEEPLNLLSAKGRAAYTKLTGAQPESGSVPGQRAAPTAAAVVPQNPQDLPRKPPPGWTLQQDAKGNKAYVSPDGKQFMEVK